MTYEHTESSPIVFVGKIIDAHFWANSNVFFEFELTKIICHSTDLKTYIRFSGRFTAAAGWANVKINKKENKVF